MWWCFWPVNFFCFRQTGKRTRRSSSCARPNRRPGSCAPNWISSKIRASPRWARKTPGCVLKIRIYPKNFPNCKMQQIQTENQQANTAPEPSAEQLLSAVTQLNTCINHLRQIDAAKQQWALENDKTADAIPPAQDLLPYFRGGIFPVCPSGGGYTINAVDVLPTCSIPGHVLPQ